MLFLRSAPTITVQGSFFTQDIDVTDFTTATIAISTLHPYVDNVIYRDSTEYQRYGAGADVNTTITVDVSNTTTLRIYTTYHANYSNIQGRRFVVSLS